MSELQEKIVRCPDCGKENKFLMHTSINLTHNPELRDQILSQRVFNYKCDCGCNTHVFYPVLVHNMDNKFMVQFCDSSHFDDYKDNFKKLIEKDPLNAMKDYKFRIVDKPFELTEKVLILESKYDDRVIEVLKEMMIASSPNQEIAYLIYAKDKEKGNVFLCLNQNNTLIGMMPFRDELYDSVLGMFGSEAMKDTNYVINQEWAREFLCEVKL